VWITGYSLGGAIALLASIRLLASDATAVDRLCTFGQPAVGSSTLCAHCDEALFDRYIRCVNHTDAVADPVSMWREHTGALWYFDVDGRLHHEVTWRQNLADHIDAPRRLGGLSQIAAHSMAAYLPLLQSLVDTRADQG